MTRAEMVQGVRELQGSLPWTELWTTKYKETGDDFQHILLNMSAMVGTLCRMAEREDHYGPEYVESMSNSGNKSQIEEQLAHLFMAVLRASNKAPCGYIDIATKIHSELDRRLGKENG